MLLLLPLLFIFTTSEVTTLRQDRNANIFIIVINYLIITVVVVAVYINFPILLLINN